MTDRSPSLMIPGAWEPRRRSNAGTVVEAGLPESAPTPLAASFDPSTIPPDASSASRWPAWVNLSMGVAVLLAAMLLVMWGTSSVVP